MSEGYVSDETVVIDATHVEARDRAPVKKEHVKNEPKKRGRKKKEEREQWLLEKTEEDVNLPLDEKTIAAQLDVSLSELRSSVPTHPEWGVKKNSEGKNALSEYFSPNIIFEFNKVYPRISPSITIQNSRKIVKQVHRQELDIRITDEGGFLNLDLDVTLFAEDEMVIVTPAHHQLTSSKKLDIGLLESETWIIREHGSGTREVTERLFTQLGISPKK